LTEGRLRYVALGGGPGKIAGARDGDEVAELMELHGEPPAWGAWAGIQPQGLGVRRNRWIGRMSRAPQRRRTGGLRSQRSLSSVSRSGWGGF
jgi:hypothetical protein